MNELPVSIRTTDPAVEVAWFSALCSDDYEFLGVPDGRLRSSFEHCSDIVTTADRLGYQNILLPSSFQVGQEPFVFAGATATMTKQIQELVAIRMGEIHPPMLARHISTLDHIMKGRLTLNIISSDLPGLVETNEVRYERSDEVIQILKQAWTQDKIDFKGRFYNLNIPSTDAVKPYQQNGGPLLYFGGISELAKTLCAKHCDVFLMWPETEDRLAATMAELSQRADAFGRKIDFGLRIHMVVRETEKEAREYADRLLSKLDAVKGAEIKARSQDSKSAGVLRQDELRAQAKDDYIEEHVWSGVGRARSGCGSALVGSPDQILKKIQRYIDMGIRAFIFSGYPHKQECELFAKYVLPSLKTCKLPVVQGRVPAQTPVTPLTTGIRR
ncbi:LLM class flavin-dependent oxidoreductase [Pedosphaera parvula]|uniref:Alkanesulfonate monooxygenase n=1 Tax=Pedosphaera parvula (strain Ellin514) TaxID=320771 RepID=B9XC52_PEDPL|nr:LLM class flavin-dependent oxidoreductase [Pedosphaera parvula]EEF62520.1 Alkanesulfonate monooxygenase [Pedosphaera parvula Ellin514]